MDDPELLERWRAGDRASGEQLFARYFAELYRFFAYKLPDKADDLVQQTFMACLKTKSPFRNEATFRTYLFTIARNELYMELRRPHRQHVDLAVSSLADLVSSPSNVLGREQELARLRAALRAIPVEQQVLLELRYWHDLSAEELAEMHATTPGAIRVRLVRARKALRAQLDDRDLDALPADQLSASLRAPEPDLELTER